MKNGRSAYFVQQSLGKKSICLDMSKPESQGIIEALVKACDIVIENYSKRAADKRGLDYATLSKINPRIIVASVSAFGRAGPYAHKTGYDWIAQGFTGVMHMTGPKDGKPHPVGIGIADSNVGVHAFSAIGYALYYREKTGKGQYLDISMVDALYHMNEITLQGYAASDGDYVPMRTGEHHPLICPCGVYKSTDGYMVLLVLQGQWSRLCDAMGRPELASDPRFDSQESRAKNQTALIPIIEAWLQTFPDDAQAWQYLEDHRVPSGPVLSPQKTINHEYYRGRGAIRTVHDSVVGKLDIPAFPLRFSEQTEFNPGAAPNLGEHNAEILADVLGYSADQISGLSESGVLVSKLD